ncbi:protein DDB G0276689-like [Aphis craccivora]|uniref:Protein DDB G0276689-like n=1 Tax=Aphis craccivora TaxID=307492 RepID=A0A6G0VQC0_APHCR|nr:protein DDB G0276689-like [Aphis craccivora]
MFRNNDQPYNQNFNHERNNNPPSYNRYNNINNINNGNTNGNQNTRNNNLKMKCCFTCNREGHFSSQCRVNSRPLNLYNRTQDGLGYVTYAYETCSYCNKRGHMADVCFKKQRDERNLMLNLGKMTKKIYFNFIITQNLKIKYISNLTASSFCSCFTVILKVPFHRRN